MSPQHLFEALSPMFFVSLLTGTGPIYSQQNNGKHQLKTSNVFKIVTISYLLIYTCSLIYGMGNLNTNTSILYFGNAMSSIGLVLDAVGQILLIYTIYVFSFITPSSIRNIIKKMAVIDSIFSNLGYKNNYNKTFWQQILLFLVGISSIAFTMGLQLYIISARSMFQLDEALWFVYYFPIVIIFVMECQFSFMVYLIYQRFKTLNGILHDMSTNGDITLNDKSKLSSVTDIQTIKTKECVTPTALRKVETLMQVHDSIIDTANEVNTNYSFQILICLTVLFIKTIFAIFFAYFEQFVRGKTDAALNWSIWTIIDWNEILLITVTCHLASTQAQQTGVEVHKLLMNSPDNIIRDKLIIFSQQIFHRPVEFTACGLFSIDAPLLFTIIGSMTTYLLIMLQFQEGNEANCIISN